MKAIPDNATHLVRGFASATHPRAKLGDLLVETWHIGASSKDVEVAAWLDRLKSGEVSRVEVIDRRTFSTEVIGR